MNRALYLAAVASVALSIPAHAMSLTAFYEFDARTQAASVHVALTTEILRTSLSGDYVRSACIETKFVAPKVWADAVKQIYAGIAASTDRDTDTEESHIVAAVKEACDNVDAPGYDNVGHRFYNTAAMLADYPKSLDRNRIIAVAVSTQAAFAKTAGHDKYAQCISAAFGTSDDQATAEFGFARLVSQIEGTQPPDKNIEQVILEAISSECGPDPK